MPIPKPNTDETKEKFIERCMGDDVMNSDYPDKDQRYAVCNTAWEGKEKKSETPQMETRSFEAYLEYRDDSTHPVLKGHAAVFEKLSENMGGMREKIAKGAFMKSIGKDDVRALWNHNPDYVLGRNKAGTLRLSEDDKGLAIEIDPPDTQWARDLMVSIKRGDVTQMSFAFSSVADSWDNEKNVRTLNEVKLYDVSPVTYPAYPQTDIKARNILSKKGIDFDKLTLALEKRDSGQDLSVEERDVITKTVEALSPDAAAGVAVVEDSKLELAKNDIIRRRINLL